MLVAQAKCYIEMVLAKKDKKQKLQDSDKYNDIFI